MKGMLQKPDMVTATGEGRKNNTRRLGGLKEINKDPDAWYCTGTDGKNWGAKNLYTEKEITVKPLYQIGETVYIKEACLLVPEDRNKLPIPNDEIVKGVYSDGQQIEYRWGDIFTNKDGIWLISVAKSYTKGKVISPLHLPEKLARYFIKIKDVRPERLQEITLPDIVLEGLDIPSEYWGITNTRFKFYAIRQLFEDLWDSINPSYPWDLNPWCFRVEYKLESVR